MVALATVVTLIGLLVAIAVAPDFAWPVAAVGFVVLLGRFAWLVWHELE